MTPTDLPRPTGTVETFDSTEGWLMLSQGNPGELGKLEPIQILGGPLAVAVFSSLETLELTVSTGRIVKIIDTSLFFEDIPPGICVALDVRKTETGTVRYFDATPMKGE